MMRRFLCETSLEGYRALSVGRHLVHDSWDQAHAFLRSALGEAHAALFAEPHAGAGGVAWMTTTATDPQPLNALDPQARAAALERLQTLRSEIAAEAAARAASPKMEDQRWAALLNALLTVPQTQDLADILYVADGQPVLVQWGVRDENATVATAALQDRIDAALRMPPPAAPPPLPPAGAVAPGPAVLAAGAGPGPGLGWLWALLLWLLFLALMAAIYWRLLLACVVAPPFGGSFGTCEPLAAAAPVAAPAERQADLLRRLDQLRGQIAQAPQCAVETALLPPAPPPAVGPGLIPAPIPDPAPRLDPAPVPTPAPEPERRPAPESAETDLDRARRQAGGQTGDVTVTLMWNGRADLDLAIACPTGGFLYFGALEACGGKLDLDANRCEQANPGACLARGWRPVPNPVENAFFVSERAPRGTYAVEVRHFAYDQAEGGGPVPFALQVRRGEETQILRGSVTPGKIAQVTTFTID